MKHLALTLLLTFGLAYPASGQDIENPSQIFMAMELYAFESWNEICADRAARQSEEDYLDTRARHHSFRDRVEQSYNLLKVCVEKGIRYDIPPLLIGCRDLMDEYHTIVLPKVTRFIHTFETDLRQCLPAWNNYIEYRIATLDPYITGLASLLSLYKVGVD